MYLFYHQVVKLTSSIGFGSLKIKNYVERFEISKKPEFKIRQCQAKVKFEINADASFTSQIFVPSAET